MNTPAKKIGYARTSTEEQSVDHQVMLLTEAGCAPEDIYIDQLSGKTRKRPRLNAALHACGPGDQLIVTRLSRLSRSLRDLMEITTELQDKGASFKVTEQAIDTSTPYGRFTFHVLGAVAEFEREMIAENTKDGIRAVRKDGAMIGRAYQLTEEQHRQIIQLKAEGVHANDIAAQFGISRGTVYSYLKKDPDDPAIADNRARYANYLKTGSRRDPERHGKSRMQL